MSTRVARSECAVPELSPTSIPIRTPLVATLLFLLLLGSRLALLAADDSQRVAPLLEGMGDHHHPITTDNPMVQRFFDQGLVLAYGFNHAEAARSFREAIRLEPDCASCYWGLSYVLGPNINSMMDASDLPEAWNALQKALEYRDKASPKEQAFIAALSKRYAAEAPDDRSHLDKAYADKMRQPGYSTVQHYWITPLYAMVRFGRWEEILEEPSPDADLIYPVGVWHYVRAIALIRTHRLAEAAQGACKPHRHPGRSFPGIDHGLGLERCRQPSGHRRGGSGWGAGHGTGRSRSWYPTPGNRRTPREQAHLRRASDVAFPGEAQPGCRSPPSQPAGRGRASLS